jgi:hypothetical protein
MASPPELPATDSCNVLLVRYLALEYLLSGTVLKAGPEAGRATPAVGYEVMVVLVQRGGSRMPGGGEPHTDCSLVTRPQQDLGRYGGANSQ